MSFVEFPGSVARRRRRRCIVYRIFDFPGSVARGREEAVGVSFIPLVEFAGSVVRGREARYLRGRGHGLQASTYDSQYGSQILRVFPRLVLTCIVHRADRHTGAGWATGAKCESTMYSSQYWPPCRSSEYSHVSFIAFLLIFC